MVMLGVKLLHPSVGLRPRRKEQVRDVWPEAT